MRKNKFTVLIAYILLFSCLVSMGCGAAGEKESWKSDPTDKLSCVATILVPADFLRQIGGDRVEVTQLLKPGSEPHSYEPSIRDMMKVTHSDLFVYGGGESDVWVEELLEGTEISNACSLMEWVSPLEEEEESLQRLFEMPTELEEEEYDEHVWTSPANSILIAQHLREELCRIDPAHEEEYRKRAGELIDKLEKLDHEFEEMIRKAPKKELVFGDRFPFLYFVRQYGLEYYAAFPGCSAETEPSAATMAYLTDHIRDHNIGMVLYLENGNGKVAEALAETTGARTAQFNSCHTGDAVTGEGYLELMERNLQVLRHALYE